MAVYWVEPISVDPGSGAGWQDADCSPYISSTATGVIIEMTTPATTTSRIGLRKNGSTDDIDSDPAQSAHMWGAIGVDASGIIEVYRATSGQDYILHGYFEDSASFFTNSVDVSLSSFGSWQDVDISSDTGADTAVAAIVQIDTGGSEFFRDAGWRKNGSTDNRVTDTRGYAGMAIVGVDVNEIFELYAQDTNNNAYLVGYITDEVTMNTNATDYSISTTGTYADMTALPVGATGGFFEIYTTNTTVYAYNLRRKGYSNDNYLDNSLIFNAHVECDTSRIIEAKIENTAVDFYLLGYSTSAVGETTINPNDGTGFINSASPTTNFQGSGLTLGERNDQTAQVKRVLLDYDLSSISSSKVTSAVLKLYIDADYSSNARTCRVYRVKRDWSGSAVTWNSYDGTNSWQTAGGTGANDIDTTEVGTRSFTAAESVSTYKYFYLSQEEVQEMIDGTFTNNGFLLKMDTESDDAYYYSGGWDGTQKHTLTIKYVEGAAPAASVSAQVFMRPNRFMGA